MGASKEKMQSLYHIENQYIHRLHEIEERQGELLPEDEEFLIINKQELQQKSIAYLEVIKNKEAFISNIDFEIKRLQALKKQNESTVTKLENSLLTAVKTYGSFEIGFTKFGTRKSESVNVAAHMINALPDEYKKRVVTETPDKVKIKAALKAGEVIAGCSLNQNMNLKIN